MIRSHFREFKPRTNSLFDYTSDSESDKPSSSKPSSSKLNCKRCHEQFEQNVELLDKNQELEDKFNKSDTEHYNTYVELNHAKDDKKELSLALSAIFGVCKNALEALSAERFTYLINDTNWIFENDEVSKIFRLRKPSTGECKCPKCSLTVLASMICRRKKNMYGSEFRTITNMYGRLLF